MRYLATLGDRRTNHDCNAEAADLQPEPHRPAAHRRVTRAWAMTWVPVGGFLAEKLAAYTLLGALLGARLGGVVQLSLAARTWLQIGLAGVLVISFGLAQLGVPGFRKIVVQPPASWMRLVAANVRDPRLRWRPPPWE